MEFSNMQEADIDGVYALESNTFSIPWSKKAFLEEVNNKFTYYLVVKDHENVIAYGGLWKIIDEGHITNIAVAKDYQRRGIGSSLVEKLIEDCKKVGIFSFTLEVRESNIKAINMYEKIGFQEEGIRKNYYEKPRENAIIMWKKLRA